MNDEPIVYVVDDDPGVLNSLRWLIESAGLSIRTYASSEAFLADFDPDAAGCLLLDIRMPGLNGLDLLDRLRQERAAIPAIMMTGYGEVPMCTRAFKSGAFDFLEKPPNDEILLTRIREAIESDADRRRLLFSRPEVAMRMSELTPREADVMEMIVNGRSQKHIAAELGISIQTVAKHRAKVLTKLNVENDVELVRLALTMQPAGA